MGVGVPAAEKRLEALRQTASGDSGGKCTPQTMGVAMPAAEKRLETVRQTASGDNGNE
jgi:hypothetical protein